MQHDGGNGNDSWLSCWNKLLVYIKEKYLAIGINNIFVLLLTELRDWKKSIIIYEGWKLSESEFTELSESEFTELRDFQN